MPAPTTVVLQARDIALLLGLFESRIMTASHIAPLFFEGKEEYTKKRLQKLKAAGFIAERPRRMNEPAVLFLTRQGFAALKREEFGGEFPQLTEKSFEDRANVSERTLAHELQIMDVKAAMYAGFSAIQNHSICKFRTWPALYEFEVMHHAEPDDILVKPDGFIQIEARPAEDIKFAYDAFLELDRSTETLDTLVRKVECYLSYYQSGGFAKRHGGTAEDFRSFPFRVLIVLKTAERRNNLAGRLAENNPPILTIAWLTTFAEITTNPLGSIWIRPRDYRAAVENSSFSDSTQIRVPYARQASRDQLVESKIEKHPLLP